MHRLFHRAPAKDTLLPEDFCDICGAPVYGSDSLIFPIGEAKFVLHGTCADKLVSTIQDIQYKRRYKQ